MTVINAVNAWQMEKKRFQNWRTAVPYTRRLVIFEVPQDFSRFFEIFRDFTRPPRPSKIEKNLKKSRKIEGNFKFHEAPSVRNCCSPILEAFFSICHAFTVLITFINCIFASLSNAADLVAIWPCFLFFPRVITSRYPKLCLLCETIPPNENAQTPFAFLKAKMFLESSVSHKLILELRHFDCR